MSAAWKKIKENKKLRQNLLIKARLLAAVRDFFAQEGFVEIDTPTLVSSPDPSPFNELFETRSLSGERLFLTPSPEFFLKKHLVAGLENIYQITKAYRDKQEKDSLHLREFTILEWYRTNASYSDLMKDCEKMVSFISKRLADKVKFDYQGRKIDLTPPWPRISCRQAFEKYANVNLDEFMDIARARKVCRGKGYQIAGAAWEELYHQVFLNEVEPQLVKLPAVILYDYPAPLAALSKIKKSDPRYAERFEFFLGSLEMGNGYSELTDFQEQEKRLMADIAARKAKRMKVFDYDHDFVEALKEGMPGTAGIAVGIDRLAMLFTDSSDIREVTPFAL